MMKLIIENAQIKMSIDYYIAGLSFQLFKIIRTDLKSKLIPGQLKLAMP